MGYFLADPADKGSVLVVALVVGTLCIPVLMHWHYLLLILGFNTLVSFAFLPGSPDLWVLLAFLSLGFAVVNRATNADFRFITVPSLNKPLFFLLAAVVITAWATGGFGMRVFGSAHYGAKNYLYLVAAIAAYFAITSQRIPSHRAGLFVGLYFLTGLSALIPNFIAKAGSSLSVLYYFFPLPGAEDDFGSIGSIPGMGRYFGLTYAAMALGAFVMARYGLRGLFDFTRPHRMFMFLAAVGACAFCGYRSNLILFLFTVAALYCFEGLWRGRSLLWTLLAVVGFGALLALSIDKLPLVVQRTVSFLPLRVNPVAQVDAENSSQWRIEMWKEVLPEVPKHLLFGKGCGMDATDMAFADENAHRGYARDYQWAILTQSYHNGPLTILVPFGIWGAIGFVWFLVAAFKYLIRNYLHGDPALTKINTFLLALFTARVLIYFLVFGAFHLELVYFTSLAGLSVSLNGTEPYREAELEPEPEAAYNEELAANELP